MTSRQTRRDCLAALVLASLAVAGRAAGQPGGGAAELSLKVAGADAAPSAWTPGETIVNVRVDPVSREALDRFTRERVGAVIEISVDGVVVSAPRLMEPITGGEFQIAGNLTAGDAERLARRIQSGAVVSVKAR